MRWRISLETSSRAPKETTTVHGEHGTMQALHCGNHPWSLRLVHQIVASLIKTPLYAPSHDPKQAAITIQAAKVGKDCHCFGAVRDRIELAVDEQGRILMEKPVRAGRVK